MLMVFFLSVKLGQNVSELSPVEDQFGLHTRSWI